MLFAELNYKIYNKEMLAIIKSVKEWRAKLTSFFYYVKVYINYKALEYFITLKQLIIKQA